MRNKRKSGRKVEREGNGGRMTNNFAESYRDEIYDLRGKLYKLQNENEVLKKELRKFRTMFFNAKRGIAHYDECGCISEIEPIGYWEDAIEGYDCEVKVLLEE